jgi:2-polyprenyl-3-methyl-5-hydroxy-6-metoxy-1,4-benzoquinol methylase
MIMWDERYSEENYVYGTDPNDFLASQCNKLAPNSRILCLAEGEGRNSVHLAKLGHSVLGVDSSSVGLEKARKLADSNGVSIETQVVDLKDFDIGEENWDVIVSIFAHLPPPLRENVHERVVKGLKKGGVFILEAYTPKQLEYKTGGPPVAEMMMTLEGLMSELHGIEFEFGRELEREVVEGKYHTGKAYTVQVFGRKPK